MAQAKITKSGWLRVKGLFGWETREQLALSIFITPSLKEILKTFGENILVLRARGERQIETKKNKLKDLGIMFSSLKNNSCVMNYDRKHHDNLTKAEIKRIYNLLDDYDIVDCAVEYLKIQIKDEELRKIIDEIYRTKYDFPVLSNVFHAEFKLEKCESEIDKEKWEDIPYNRDVLLRNGFKKSLLHCYKLIDDGQIYNLRKQAQKVYYINWEPSKKSVRIEDLKSPIEIVSALKSCLAPYGYTKYYKPTKEDRLELTKID